MIILFVGAAAFSISLAAEDNDISKAGAKVEIITENAANIYAAGARVSIKGMARQDIFAAGALVTIDAESGGDLGVAGAQVNINGKVFGEAWIAGAELNINAESEKSLNAAGASIRVSESAKLAADSSLAGALIEFSGVAGDNLTLYGDEVMFSGQSTGSVTIEGHKVQLGENAHIEGDLIIRSSEKADISSSATIVGALTETDLSDSTFMRKDEGIIATLRKAAIFAASAFILGLILIVFLPGTVEQGITRLRTQPAKNILWGFAVFFGIPIFAIIAMVTIVGAPVGVGSLLLLPFLLLLGFTFAALGASNWFLSRDSFQEKNTNRLLFLAMSLIVLIAIALIPVIGGLVIFLAIIYGLGAAVVTIGHRLRSKSEESSLIGSN
ncbi:MAG: hypothetical protein AB8D52_10030 [Gammaproteobacteria bacterium]